MKTNRIRRNNMTAYLNWLLCSRVLHGNCTNTARHAYNCRSPEVPASRPSVSGSSKWQFSGDPPQPQAGPCNWRRTHSPFTPVNWAYFHSAVFFHFVVVIQTGAYFGAVVCAMKVDRDTITDLILISAPMYIDEDRQGRVYVCTLSGLVKASPPC